MIREVLQALVPWFWTLLVPFCLQFLGIGISAAAHQQVRIAKLFFALHSAEDSNKLNFNIYRAVCNMLKFMRSLVVVLLHFTHCQKCGQVHKMPFLQQTLKCKLCNCTLESRRPFWNSWSGCFGNEKGLANQFSTNRHHECLSFPPLAKCDTPYQPWVGAKS